MREQIDVLEHAGLPIFEDGRGFEVSYEDRACFSLSELERLSRVTLADDRGRSIEFKVGGMSTITVTSSLDGPSQNVPLLIISDLRGELVGSSEQIQTGLYLKDGSLDVELFPPRETGQESPATKQGLRLVVNPWRVFRVAPSKIEVHKK